MKATILFWMRGVPCDCTKIDDVMQSWIAPISVDIPVAVTTPMQAPLEMVVEAKSMFTSTKEPK